MPEIILFKIIMCDDIDYDIKRPRGRPRKNQNNYIDMKNQKAKPNNSTSTQHRRCAG